MTTRTRKRECGFSLIELMAAMAIFSMSVLACLELYSVSLQSAGDSVAYTQAVFLAQGVMEETMAESYLLAGSNSGEFGPNYPEHAWEMVIEETDETGLMALELTVRWTVRGREKTYILATRYADRDISEALP
jgi:general secretion pathway protein I